MGVRVRVRILIKDRSVEAHALANSGFETERPQLLVPYAFLVRNNINLEDLGRPDISEYDTAGGLIVMYIYHGACKVTVIEHDRISRDVEADLVLLPVEKEILMSDAPIEELGIVLISPRSSLWRFIDDPPEAIRRSYSPQYW